MKCEICGGLSDTMHVRMGRFEFNAPSVNECLHPMLRCFCEPCNRTVPLENAGNFMTVSRQLIEDSAWPIVEIVNGRAKEHLGDLYERAKNPGYFVNG